MGHEDKLSEYRKNRHSPRHIPRICTKQGANDVLVLKKQNIILLGAFHEKYSYICNVCC